MFADKKKWLWVQVPLGLVKNLYNLLARTVGEIVFFNPIQAGGEGGGGGAKMIPYQFFPCNFYKHKI